MMAGSAAAFAAVAVVVGWVNGSWIKEATAAFAAGLGTLVVYVTAMFVRGLIKAPLAVRGSKVQSVRGPEFHASVEIPFRVIARDTMQKEASVIRQMANGLLNGKLDLVYDLGDLRRRVGSIKIRGALGGST